MADKDIEKEASKIFSVPDFVGDACKAIASRIRGAVAGVQFDDFHKVCACGCGCVGVWVVMCVDMGVRVCGRVCVHACVHACMWVSAWVWRLEEGLYGYICVKE